MQSNSVNNSQAQSDKQVISTVNIGFIGGGNMAVSLIGGLLQAGINAEKILVAEPDKNRCEKLTEQFSVRCTQNNADILRCDHIILAVKPQIMRHVCEQLYTATDIHTTATHLFISIAAGIRIESINRWLGGNRAIVRCMPNTPALVQCGATALVANAAVSAEQKQQAEKILEAVGLALWVDDEAQINAVTAVSGSGPAYFFLMMEAMQAAGEKLGLNHETSLQLVLQTALGAARMASEPTPDNKMPQPPASLREQVTSKGGTTAAAIASFEANNFRKIVEQALQSAHDRSISLSEELGAE